MMGDIVWTSAIGVKTKLSKLTHQHLSNILWFNEVFNGANENNSVQVKLLYELEKRFDGKRLFWKPLPVPNEIDWLRGMGLINDKGYIIGNRNTGLFEGRVIGITKIN